MRTKIIVKFDHILISLLLFNKVDKMTGRCCLGVTNS
jgi:hypothetical protein